MAIGWCGIFSGVVCFFCWVILHYYCRGLLLVPVDAALKRKVGIKQVSIGGAPAYTSKEVSRSQNYSLKTTVLLTLCIYAFWYTELVLPRLAALMVNSLGAHVCWGLRAWSLQG